MYAVKETTDRRESSLRDTDWVGSHRYDFLTLDRFSAKAEGSEPANAWFIGRTVDFVLIISVSVPVFTVLKFSTFLQFRSTGILFRCRYVWIKFFQNLQVGTWRNLPCAITSWYTRYVSTFQISVAIRSYFKNHNIVTNIQLQHYVVTFEFSE